LRAKGAPAARWDKKSALTTGVIVSCLGGCLPETCPFLLQLVTGAFFVSQTLPERRIQTQTVAHLRSRTTGGLDVETGDLVGNGKQ
jgi:hypothetical protein